MSVCVTVKETYPDGDAYTTFLKCCTLHFYRLFVGEFFAHFCSWLDLKHHSNTWPVFGYDTFCIFFWAFSEFGLLECFSCFFSNCVINVNVCALDAAPRTALFWSKWANVSFSSVGVAVVADASGGGNPCSGPVVVVEGFSPVQWFIYSGIRSEKRREDIRCLQIYMHTINADKILAIFCCSTKNIGQLMEILLVYQY